MTIDLCDPMELPPFEALTPAAIVPKLQLAPDKYDVRLAALTAQPAFSFDETWLPLERASLYIEALWSAVSHLNFVADTPPLREAHARGKKLIVEHTMRSLQDRLRFDMLTALTSSPYFAELPTEDQVAVEHTIRDATLFGAGLAADKRQYIIAISVELSSLSTAFSTAVQDATDRKSYPLMDHVRLSGLPPASLAIFAAEAKARGAGGWVVTLQQPSVAAVLAFAEDRELRREVYTAYATRASDCGPNAAQFDKSMRMERILALRHEAAALLGFVDPVELSLVTKMASNSDAISTFLRDFVRRARGSAEDDVLELRAFAQTRLAIDEVEPWDVAFASDRLRRALHSIDEQEVRDYFPIGQVTAGWQALLKRLFGIDLVRRNDVALWCEDASYWDANDENGTVFAGLYLDLRARAAKRGCAWMAQALPKLDDGNLLGVPVAYLVCNFAPNGDGEPALLSHSDVITLLHETGHALPLLLTLVKRPSIAGTNGVEWDAVELPNQLMEDFGWDREVLTSMSGHVPTSEPLAYFLFDGLVRARHFQAGLLVLRQIEFPLFDILIHSNPAFGPLEVFEKIRDEIAVLQPPRRIAYHTLLHISSLAGKRPITIAICGQRCWRSTAWDDMPELGRSTVRPGMRFAPKCCRSARRGQWRRISSHFAVVLRIPRRSLRALI